MQIENSIQDEHPNLALFVEGLVPDRVVSYTDLDGKTATMVKVKYRVTLDGRRAGSVSHRLCPLLRDGKTHLIPGWFATALTPGIDSNQRYNSLDEALRAIVELALTEQKVETPRMTATPAPAPTEVATIQLIVTLEVTPALNQSIEQAKVDMATLFTEYITSDEHPFLTDYGATVEELEKYRAGEAADDAPTWGGYEGPYITKATVATVGDAE